MPSPEDRHFDWKPLLQKLEDLLLQGTSSTPFPVELRHAAEALGYRLSDNDTQAALEAAALFGPLSETSLPPKEALPADLSSGEEPPTWTGAQLRALRLLSGHPPRWWVSELAGLLRRSSLPWPAPALPAAFALIEQEPESFPALAPLLGPEARAESAREARLRWIWPSAPPDPALGPPSPLYLLHWLLTDPDNAGPWLAEHAEELPVTTTSGLLQEAGHRLPQAALPWLRCREGTLPESDRPALLAARARLGDEEARGPVSRILATLVRIEGRRLEADLPPPGPAWGELLPQGQGVTRQALLTGLWTAWHPADMAHSLGRSAAELAEAAFRSPQAELLTAAMFAQLRHFPEPRACLAWLEARMRHPEIPCGDQERQLARHLPHETLSKAISQHIHAERYLLDADGPAARLLAGGSLFWTEALTRDVVDALQARPALAAEMVQRRELLEAFLWRGHLGTWYRMQQAARPFGDLPPLLQRRVDEITPVIECRATLHRAFRKTA